MNSRKALLLALLALTGCPRDINHHPVRLAVTSLASCGVGGVHGNGVSSAPSVTPDGRYLAFVSSSTNLTPAGSGGHRQVYRRDLQTGETLLISTDPLGLPGNGDSETPAISADGLRIAFRSTASTFSPDALILVPDIYVRDLSVIPPVTILMSGAAGGGPGDPAIGSFSPSISQDGVFVAFLSDASTLTAPSLPAGGFFHAFRRPVAGGPAELVDVRSDGTPGASGPMSGVSISADGRFVAFDSTTDDLGGTLPGNFLSNVYIRDMSISVGAVVLASPSADPSILDFTMQSTMPSISADGTRVAFISGVPNLVPDDLNGAVADVFVRDLSDPLNPRTLLVSRRSDGAAEDNAAKAVAIAPDGRSVAFLSQATNLVDGDFNHFDDVFWHDLASGKTVRVSVDTAQREALGSSGAGLGLTGDGRFVLFASEASNLVTGDTNGLSDVFIRGPLY